MEPILTREEIADLLSAIKAGRISTDFIEDGPSKPGRLVHAHDLDLFRTYERGHDSGEMRVPNLDIILDSFARNFGINLTNTLQRNFTVEREAIVTNSFQQCLRDLENQGAVGIYTITPLKYGGLFHFDNLLSFSLLEIMLGSAQASESLTPDRQLTTIEMAILKTTMNAISNELQKAFKPIIELLAYLTKVENNYRLVSIVDPDTEVLVTRFSVQIASEHVGQMRFIVPYLTLEPLRDKFKALVTMSQAASANWAKFFAHEVQEVESEVSARSGQISMSIRKLLALKPGDIINLPYNPDQPLTIMVEDQPLFLAIAGERNGKRAFHVTGRYSNRSGGIHGDS